MPEALLNTGNCFSVRLRAPNTGSMDISGRYMANFICDYCKRLLERGIRLLWAAQDLPDPPSRPASLGSRWKRLHFVPFFRSRMRFAI